MGKTFFLCSTKIWSCVIRLADTVLKSWNKRSFYNRIFSFSPHLFYEKTNLWTKFDSPSHRTPVAANSALPALHRLRNLDPRSRQPSGAPWRILNAARRCCSAQGRLGFGDRKKSTFLSVWLFMLLWKLYSIYIYLYIYIYKKKGKQTETLITSTTWKMGDFKSGFRRRVYKSQLIYHYINFGLHYAFI